MKWYNLSEASSVCGKSKRTIRYHLNKLRQEEAGKRILKTHTKYIKDHKNNPVLYISDQLLQGIFEDVQDLYTPAPEGVQSPLQPSIDYEARWNEREALLREHYEKQIERIEEAKGETIDVLKAQAHTLNENLNKVLEQYALAQMTIQNLLNEAETVQPLQLDTDDAEEVQDIIDEQQTMGNKMSTTREYYRKKGFGDWLEPEP